MMIPMIIEAARARTDRQSAQLIDEGEFVAYPALPERGSLNR